MSGGGNPDDRLDRLIGRLPERRLLQRLVADVALGRGRALVLQGEEGVGKSALLRHLVDLLPGWRVVSVTGTPTGSAVPYGALHRLCEPLLPRAGTLPPPQREALEASFGLRPGPSADPAMTAIAAWSLIAGSAQASTTALVVDDAHWLDPASAAALAYVSRRLGSTRVALVCAARPSGDGDPLALLPVHRLDGLAAPDACLLLQDSLPGPIDGSVAARIVAECRGNPRALLELAATRTPTQLAGGFAVAGGQAVPPPFGIGWAEQIEQLPSDTQLLLVTAAAEPLGDPLLLRRAGEFLGIHLDALGPAVDAGLVQLQTRVLFAHPLVRDVAYRSCSDHRRSLAHHALCAATDPDVDPDRRAWHRAGATRGQDAAVATALEAAAARAHARGGLAARAAFLSRATELTTDPAVRSRRAVEAAGANLEAGGTDEARALLAVARSQPTAGAPAVRMPLVEARLALAHTGGNAAVSLFVDAAHRLRAVDRNLARETFVEALAAALSGSRPGRAGDLDDAARAARSAFGEPGDTSTAGLLLEALAALAEDRPSTPVCDQALRALTEENGRGESRWLWHGTILALQTWDDAAARLLAERHVQHARTSGAPHQLVLALGSVAVTAVLDGDLSAADSRLVRSRALRRATGGEGLPPGDVVFHAWRGRAEDRSIVDREHHRAAVRGDVQAAAMAGYAQAVLGNASASPVEALSASHRAVVEHDGLARNWCLAELVEAAARAGRRDIAADAALQISYRARAAGSAWASGVAARAEALVSSGDDAAEAFELALQHLRRARVRAELARTHLLYGEWLRRRDRRADSRTELDAAHDHFLAMGMEGFANRARKELALAGLAPRRPSGDAREGLTEQEAQIARLARDGWSNPEIGSRLFLSSRTVEWHLRKVFAKLGISSRRELRRVLCDAA